MGKISESERELLKAANISHVEVLDENSIVVTFSNGMAARVECESVKQLVLTSATEVALPESGSE